MWTNHITQIHWEPSDKCNSGCIMCPRYDKKGNEIGTLENTEWTLDQFINAWPEQFIKKLWKILACGNFGDPCACREFVDIYEYCRKVAPGIGLAVNTNGSLRTPDWWYRLGKVLREDQNPGNYCTFSLDGLEDTNHIYRVGTDWSKIMRNVEAFIEGGGIAHWDFIAFEHNEHQIEHARQMAKDLGFHNFNVKRTTRWGRYTDDGQGYKEVYRRGKYLWDIRQPNEEQFKHNFQEASYFKQSKYQSLTMDDFKNMEGVVNKDLRHVDGEWKEIILTDLSVACRSVKHARENQPFDEIYISAGGTVAPCCFLGSEPFVDTNVKSRDENYLSMIDAQGGLDKFNMHKNNIYDILKMDIFQRWIPDTWDKDGNKSMRPAKCGQCCGVEFNSLDYGELGAKKDSYFEGKDPEFKGKK